MNHRQLFSFSNTCWIKIEVLHFRERWCTIAPENVTSITFLGSITFSVVTEHARMPISSLSSQRNLNCMLLKKQSLGENGCHCFCNYVPIWKIKCFISSFEIKIVWSFFTLSTFICKEKLSSEYDEI